MRTIILITLIIELLIIIMKTPTRTTPFAAYLILGLMFSGLLLSSCEREEKTCVEKDRTYLDTFINPLLEYENNIFNIYKGNDTMRLKESSTGIIHTFVSKPVNQFYVYYSDFEPGDKCLRYTKYENKEVVFYRTDDQSRLSISINPRFPSGFDYFTIYYQRVPFYDVSSRFTTGREYTYKEYTIEGIKYDSVFKVITDSNRDSLFYEHYALYNKSKGVLAIKFPGGNTFTHIE
jgi:hypothetical protein